MKGIADTGFVVAFANRRDRHHAWATALAQEISEPLLTCDAVVAESVFHLQSAELVPTRLHARGGDFMMRLALGCEITVKFAQFFRL